MSREFFFRSFLPVYDRAMGSVCVIEDDHIVRNGVDVGGIYRDHVTWELQYILEACVSI